MLQVNFKQPKTGALVKSINKPFAAQLEREWFRGLPEGRPKVLYSSVTLSQVHHGPYNTHISSAYFMGCESFKYRMVPLLIYRHEIARARNLAVTTAIRGGFTYLVFVDDDTHLHEATIGRLVGRMDEFNACSAGYYIRGYPFAPMVFVFDGEERKRFHLPDPFNYKHLIDEDGVMRADVAALGCGVTMFRVADFKRIPYPWFQTGPSHTEDVYWFHKAHALMKRPYKVGMDFNIVAGHQCEPLVVNTRNVEVLRDAYAKMGGHNPPKNGGGSNGKNKGTKK
jgi:hypothetical protein